MIRPASTPWKPGAGKHSRKNVYSGNGSRLIACCNTNEIMAHGDEAENALFICMAVNSHEQLRVQLKLAVSVIKAKAKNKDERKVLEIIKSEQIQQIEEILERTKL